MPSPKHRTATNGRPTKLTVEVQKTICDALQLGAYREVAAAAAGVSRSTFFGWLARGHEWDDRRDEVPAAERPFLDFLDAVSLAVAVGEQRLTETVVSAAPKDWRAAAWTLERRHPERWARRAPARPPVEAPKPMQPMSQEEVDAELESWARMMDSAVAVARGPEAVRPPVAE